MSINIYVDQGAIYVSQNNANPRVYWGGLGASGKFYPSGTSGAIYNLGLEVAMNTIYGLDGSFDDVPSVSSSSSGIPEVRFAFEAIDGSIINSSIQIYGNASLTSNYAIGDTFTINGSLFGENITGQLILRVKALDIDGLEIVIGGDWYSVKWYNLLVGGDSCTSLLDAQEKLATLFSNL